MTKTEIIKLFVAVIIFAVVIAVVAVLGRIDTTQTIQLIITFVLVLVTVAYVKRTAEIASATKEQANASVKMAEEMRDTRYDALRPIIDFRFRDSEERSGGALGIGARGEVPSELHGQLCNIGVGPAIDLYSFSKVDQVTRPRYDFEALKAGELSRQVALSVAQEGSIGILEVYYKDVYDNSFRSRIEIHPIKGQGLRTKLQVEKV